MTDPFNLGTPGTPDGPPGSDPDDLDTDALSARREAAETLLRGVGRAVKYLAGLVDDDSADPKERRQAAQALLGFSGVSAVTGRVGAPGAGTDPLSAVMGLLDGQPRSRWAASAVGRQRCSDASCDWPAHRGGELAHGHTVDAGYQDGCSFRHGMLSPCGPVPEGSSTRSEFWNNSGTAPRTARDAPPTWKVATH